LKKISCILTLSAFLAGAHTAHAASDAEAAPSIRPIQTAAVAGDPLPAVRLSQELMFKYLSAELAEQRGEFMAAHVTMMSIARTTRDPRLARRAGEMAMNGKLGADALAAARLWLDIAPRSEEAAQVVVGLLVATNRLDEVTKILAKQLANSAPLTLGASIAQTQRLLSRVQDKPKAIALLKELLAPYRDALDAKLALAQLAFANGDLTTGLREAREASAQFPQSEVAVLTLAQMTSDKNAAAKVLSDFLQKNPQARDVRLAHARMLFEQSKLEEARKEFKTLLMYAPEDPTALYAMGLLSVQTNDLADGEKYLSAYIKGLNGAPDGERDATQALMVLAQIAEDRNDLPGALAWLDLVESTSQTAYLGATLKRAQIKAKSGNLEEARLVLTQANAESDDERIRLIIGEAQLLRDAGQFDEAMHILDEGLQRFVDNTDLLYEHAMVAEKSRQFDVMEQSLRKVMQLAPDNPHAYNALGYGLADRNLRLPEAYDLIKKALELAPEDPFIMDSMGWVEFRLGRLEKAEELLRRAYAIKPDPEIAVHLGEVLWVKGREDEAKTLWRQANDKDPKNESLKGTLVRFQVNL